MPKLGIGEILHHGSAVLRARWYLRAATELGQRVRVWGAPIVRNRGVLLIRDRVRMVSTITASDIQVGPQGTLTIGEGTFINYGASIGATLEINIGPRCNIGPYAMLMDNDFHRLEPERRTEAPDSAPITLEENVWLGARVTVLRGVTIGAGSVIATGSVVTRDIPPRSLAGGLPAKVIRSL